MSRPLHREAPRRSPAGALSLAALALAGVVAAGCAGGDEPSGPRDTVAPQIVIRAPADDSTIVAPDHRPSIRVELSDAGSGIFDSTIQGTIDGKDISDALRNGFDEPSGEIVVKSPVPVEDGSRLLVVTVSDRAGNEARTQSRFTVSSIVAPPPPAALAPHP